MAKVFVTIAGQINHIEIERWANGNVVFTSDFVACGNTNDHTLIGYVMNTEQPKNLIYALINKCESTIIDFLEEMKEGGKLDFEEIEKVEFEIELGEDYEIFFAFYESEIRNGIIEAYEAENTTNTEYFEIYADGRTNSFNRSGAWRYAPDAEEPIYAYGIEASTMAEILRDKENLDENGNFDASNFVDYIWDNIQSRIDFIIEEETQRQRYQ